ncbi:unnamed protein product [Pieris brassicae]|uniref:HTH psq-type domain-containing protein n=1 Tax=Pieris brassicae TaxID=7116 RepID=A0A9P0TJJ6_PIEBR|nr:unnamed protein product [Pieris brassicae]
MELSEMFPRESSSNEWDMFDYIFIRSATHPQATRIWRFVSTLNNDEKRYFFITDNSRYKQQIMISYDNLRRFQESVQRSSTPVNHQDIAVVQALLDERYSISTIQEITFVSVFGMDSPLGLFPPGMEHKMYPLMDVDHRPPPLDAQLFTNVKKKWRPKGQHSAPRGGPPRSWTNAELTEALQHVWNKKMTTSQASRIFGIPYNSLLMYVRGKYGKSLKLEQLRKDCIGGPLEVLNLNSGNNNNNHPSSKHSVKEEQHQNIGQRPASSEPDISSNPMFNPFQQGFYPEFPPGFPMPLNMLHLLPPSDKARELYQSMPMALDSLSGVAKEEDCKSDRSKENSADEEGDTYRAPSHPPHPPDNRTLLHHNGQD